MKFLTTLTVILLTCSMSMGQIILSKFSAFQYNDDIEEYIPIGIKDEPSHVQVETNFVVFTSSDVKWIFYTPGSLYNIEEDEHAMSYWINGIMNNKVYPLLFYLNKETQWRSFAILLDDGTMLKYHND